MSDQNFTCNITANVTTTEAVTAISHVSDWWARDLEGRSEKPGDIFTVKFGNTFVTFEIIELIPNAKIVWAVTDCYLHFQEDKTEWTSTKIVFEIFTKNDMTNINITHVGLVPEVECYDNCVKGWTGYITGSLSNLLTTGRGNPA